MCAPGVNTISRQVCRVLGSHRRDGKLREKREKKMDKLNDNVGDSKQRGGGREREREKRNR